MTSSLTRRSTTFPNEVSATVHDRMPLIVQPKDYARWLDRGNADIGDILAPCPSDGMIAYPVSRRVNERLRLARVPHVPHATKEERRFIGHSDAVGCFPDQRLLPLVVAVRRYQAAPLADELAEHRLLVRRLRSRVDGPRALLRVLPKSALARDPLLWAYPRGLTFM